MRPATKHDSSKLLKLYSESLAHAQKVGKIDWPDPISQSFINSLLENKNLFCFEKDDTIIAAAKLSRKPDRKIWPSQESALYIGRLATAETVRGTRFFQEQMLPAIIDYVGPNAKLRLNCLADNEPLKTFYRNLGFIPQADVAFYSPQQAAYITVTPFERLTTS